MTPLEEKIEEILQIASGFEKENGIIPITKVLLKQCLEAIATQAAEEEHQRLLEWIDKNVDEFQRMENSPNYVLNQVRNIISKPNI